MLRVSQQAPGSADSKSTQLLTQDKPAHLKVGSKLTVSVFTDKWLRLHAVNISNLTESWLASGDARSGMRNLPTPISKHVTLTVYPGNVAKLACALWCEYGATGRFHHCGWFEIGDDGLSSHLSVRDSRRGSCKGRNRRLRIQVTRPVLHKP